MKIELTKRQAEFLLVRLNCLSSATPEEQNAIADVIIKIAKKLANEEK